MMASGEAAASRMRIDPRKSGAECQSRFSGYQVKHSAPHKGSTYG